MATENERHQKPDIPSLGSQSTTDSVKVRDIEYTRNDCIEDISRLAEVFPGRRITRDFYRENSNIPEKAWTGLFGTFPEFLRAADLEHTRYAAKVRTQVAKHAAHDKLKEVSEQRREYGNRYLREKRGRWKTLVGCSDLHDKECDPFYLRVLFETIKTVDPDVVCIDGDLFDLPEFSRHPKDPREWDTVGRIQAGNAIVGNIREAAPEAQIDLIEGNHEARLVKHMMDASPALRSLLGDLHGFDIIKLLKLDEHEVNYVADADLHAFTDAQLRREMVKNYRMYWNCLLAHHFPVGKEKGVPGFNGHHHRHIVWTENNARFGSYEWHQLGAGHVRDAVYCDGTKWNNGFVIANVDTQTESVAFDYTYVGDTFAVSGGTWYYREPHEFYPALEKELDFRRNGG